MKKSQEAVIFNQNFKDNKKSVDDSFKYYSYLNKSKFFLFS